MSETFDNTYIEDYLFHRILQFLDSTDIEVEHNTFKEHYKESDYNFFFFHKGSSFFGTESVPILMFT